MLRIKLKVPLCLVLMAHVSCAKKFLLLAPVVIVYLSCGASSAAEYDLPKVGMRVQPPCAALKYYLIFLIRIDLDFLLSLLSGHITAFFLYVSLFQTSAPPNKKPSSPPSFIIHADI